MFESLLENTDQTMYQIFCCLEEQATCSLEQLALQTNKTPLAIRRLLQNWQITPANQTLGIGFHLSKKEIRAIYSKESATLFFSNLLHRSTQFQLLMQLANEPFTTLRELQEHLHLSKSTIQRRLVQLQDFLNPYQLSVSFKKSPSLKGPEVQIRWLLWQLSLASDPPFFPMPTFYFQRYQEISEQRCLNGFPLMHAWEPPVSYFFKQQFQLDERGLLFLWQQLLGTEEYSVNEELYDCLDFALQTHTPFDTAVLAKLHDECHQLHSLCALYQGPFFIQKRTIRPEVQAVLTSLTRLLPAYRQLLYKHPEIPQFYQYLFDKYHAQGAFLVAET